MINDHPAFHLFPDKENEDNISIKRDRIFSKDSIVKTLFDGSGKKTVIKSQHKSNK
jgi:hypothetical protein